MAPRPVRAGDGYRYPWALFTDWCAAADTSPLPASPITLAEFLDENPAGDTVQLRRVSAINRAHLDAGLPAPGRVTSLRLAVDSARTARTTRRAAHYQAIAAALPTMGSTAALFGRRDAVLLLLAGAGLSYKAIAALDRGDLAVVGGSVWIGGEHRIRMDPNESTDFRPVQIWDRWRTVLQFSDRYPSTTLLAEHLQRNTFPDMSGLPERPGPVAVPIDRWGHLPLLAAPMTPAEIGSVIAAHRTGTPPLHHTPRRHTTRPSEDTDQIQTVVPREPVSPELDAGYYRSGVDARRRAHTALADVTGMVDDVADRIEALLQRTLDLLGDETTPR